MYTVSISQLKVHPTEVISRSADYPVAVSSRNQIKAYLVGRELYEKLVSHVEDFLDRRSIESTDFRKGRDFEEVAQELDL